MKRVLDILVVMIGSPIWVPAMALTAIWIRISIGTPILFRQIRPGLNGQEFEMYKFRTMSDERSSNGDLLPDADRLTSSGRIMRSLSLDELPELFNILKGDMSLVGPRPLLPEYLPLYSQRQARRHEVRPGLTGWAQINGRNNISWPDKLEMDIWYVENKSLILDMKILFRTVFQVLSRAEVSKDGQATTDKFRGQRLPEDIS